MQAVLCVGDGNSHEQAAISEWLQSPETWGAAGDHKPAARPCPAADDPGCKRALMANLTR